MASSIKRSCWCSHDPGAQHDKHAVLKTLAPGSHEGGDRSQPCLSLCLLRCQGEHSAAKHRPSSSSRSFPLIAQPGACPCRRRARPHPVLLLHLADQRLAAPLPVLRHQGRQHRLTTNKQADAAEHVIDKTRQRNLQPGPGGCTSWHPCTLHKTCRTRRPASATAAVSHWSALRPRLRHRRTRPMPRSTLCANGQLRIHRGWAPADSRTAEQMPEPP